MLDAAKTAEAVLVTGQAPGAAGQLAQDEEEDEAEGRPSSPTPSSSTTAMDVSNLTPQTYLVRPTRPDASRNRGRKAFKRNPAPKPASDPSISTAATPQAETTTAGTEAPTRNTGPSTQEVDDEVDALPEIDEYEDLIEEMEHLQLSLEEAWFLSAALGVLKVYDPATVSSEIWVKVSS
jgi:tRNA-splicing endonuclease subunit Sen2